MLAAQYDYRISSMFFLPSGMVKNSLSLSLSYFWLGQPNLPTLSLDLKYIPKTRFYTLYSSLDSGAAVFIRVEPAWKVKVLAAQSCPALYNRLDYSSTGFSVFGIFQERILEWVAFHSPGDLSNPRIEPWSPTLQANFLPSEPPGKP